jgi:nicotinate-nucleotide--dimethylbenzimidazole phosphoribosyltransferase
MSERECAATMAFGMEVLAKQPDLLILAGVGPGADAAAASLIEALAGGTDPLQLLQRLGGRETAAIAGAIVGARSQAIPILLDGLPALAAAAVVAATSPGAADHCRLAAPVGDAKLLEQAGFEPVADLDIARTDGTGGLVALSIVKLASAMAGAPA